MANCNSWPQFGIRWPPACALKAGLDIAQPQELGPRSMDRAVGHSVELAGFKQPKLHLPSSGRVEQDVLKSLRLKPTCPAKKAGNNATEQLKWPQPRANPANLTS